MTVEVEHQRKRERRAEPLSPHARALADQQWYCREAYTDMNGLRNMGLILNRIQVDNSAAIHISRMTLGYWYCHVLPVVYHFR